MRSNTEKNARQAERIALLLPVRVEAKDAHNKNWSEITHLEAVSKIGAGFYLNRPFEVGQLLLVNLPMKNELQRFDGTESHYAVWGVVRHCHRTLRNEYSVYHIGVAFIGREAPFSYRQNPLTIYKIGELKSDGFWQITEEVKTALPRKETRYTIPVEVSIAVFDAEENLTAHEQTVTENVSEGGAAVFSALPLNVGDTVKVIKQYGNFEATAIVRNRRTGADNLPRLHLEFVNVRFPLDGIG